MEPVISVYSFAIGFGANLSSGFTEIFYESFNHNWALALGVWSALAIVVEQGMSLLTASSVLITMTIVQLVGNILIPSLINKYPNRIAWLHGLVFIGLFGSVFFFIDAFWAIWLGTII